MSITRPQDVFIVVGQSNAVGQDNAVGYSSAPINCGKWVQSSGTWEQLSDPYDDINGTHGASFTPSFAWKYQLLTSRTVGFIPGATNSIGFTWPDTNNWGIRGTAYNNMLARAQAAGGPYVGTLVWAGESDAVEGRTQSAIQSAIVTYISNHRSDLSDPNHKFWFNKVALASYDCSNVNNAIAAVCASDPTRCFVLADVSGWALTDGIHASKYSQDGVGDVMGRLVTDGTSSSPGGIATSPTFWWEGEYFDGYTDIIGGKRALLRDRGGSGYIIPQSDSGVRPSSTSIYASFDGTSNVLGGSSLKSRDLGSYISANALQCYAVVKIRSVDTTNGYPNNLNDANNDAIFCDDSGNVGLHFQNRSGTCYASAYAYDSTPHRAYVSFSLNDMAIIGMKLSDGTLSVRNIRTGSTDQIAGCGNIGNMTGAIQVGKSGTASSYLDGNLYSLITFNSSLSDSDETSVEIYLKNKYEQEPPMPIWTIKNGGTYSNFSAIQSLIGDGDTVVFDGSGGTVTDTVTPILDHANLTLTSSNRCAWNITGSVASPVDAVARMIFQAKADYVTVTGIDITFGTNSNRQFIEIGGTTSDKANYFDIERCSIDTNGDPCAISNYSQSTNARIVNNIIKNTSASKTSMLAVDFSYNAGTSFSIINNTFYNVQNGPGFYYNPGGGGKILNNIIVGKGSSGDGIDSNAVYSTEDYNCVRGFNNNFLHNGGPNTHDLNGTDPLFVGSGDYRLQNSSPCKAAGIGPASDSDVPSIDFLGHTRAGSITSMGAYVIEPASSFSSSSVTDGSSVTSIVNIGSLVDKINAYSPDTYFDSTNEVAKVIVFYTQAEGRQVKRITHKPPNFETPVSWSSFSRDGTWEKSEIRAFDYENATNTLPGSAIDSVEDLYHSGGTMLLNL